MAQHPRASSDKPRELRNVAESASELAEDFYAGCAFVRDGSDRYPEAGRSKPMSAERREDLIVRAAAGVTAIYRYFEPHRRMLADRGSEHLGPPPHEEDRTQ